MKFIGIWRFHSIGVMGDDALTYMNGEEYLASPMSYIDESDDEAVESELRARKMLISSCVEICEDGMLYILLPLPEEATQEEIDEAVESGDIALRHNMMTTQAMAWEIRDGELWYNSGIEGEVFGEKADSWVKGIDENGFFTFITTRYIKEEE